MKPEPLFHVVREGDAEVGLDVRVVGEPLLRAPLTNKGTAFAANERVELALSGLLPPRIESLEEQRARAYALYSAETTPLGRYRFLRRVQDTNEVLFYALLERHLREMLPIVYTPTVGAAVEGFSAIWEEPRGLCFAVDDPRTPAEIVAGCPLDDVRMVVATDASAILGIGDQGFNGLAIAIGKLALYTVGGGVSPYRCLPIVIDVGTDRPALRDDPAYLGVRRPRLRGEPYLAFVRGVVEAIAARWPRAIVQWEDFGKESAFAVLDAFRGVLPSFNDDIQGTGAVALAGLVAAVHAKGSALAEERYLVFGAGAGGVGVATAIRGGLERAGLSPEEARARVFVVDSKGLLVEGRAMEPYKAPSAQPRSAIAGWKTAGEVPTFAETIVNGKVGALLGLSGQPGAFREELVRAVAANTARPIVFALSNPTSACEAIPADVLRWTGGAAIVATGSPFEPVELDGKRHVVGQGNNAFVFPGLGFGAILADARAVTDGMIAEAVDALAAFTIERHGAAGLVYPPVEDLREASVRVAARVARRAIADGVAGRAELEAHGDVEATVRRIAWQPRYLPFRRA